MQYTNASQDKTIAYLAFSSKDLKSDLQELSKITWSEKNKEVYNLCKAYIKLESPDFTLTDYIIDQSKNKTHIANLLTIDSGISSGLGKINMEALIESQENANLKNTLIGLRDKPANEVLKEVKNLKGIRSIKPLNLEEVKAQRIIDRKYEKLAPSTGFIGLDSIIKGFVSGHTITMTGDTNVGKTQVCCNFAYNVAKQAKKVLYFSLEPDITVIEYLASIWARKTFNSVTEDDLTPPKGINIDVYTKEHVKTLDDMVSVVENSERYDLIIIDHFGYFTSIGNNKTQVESNAMKTMASFSKRNKTCVLIVVHPRKTSPSKKQKGLSIQDISGSAAFSQDATDVLIVMRKKDEDDPLNIKYLNDGYIAVHKTKAGGNGASAIKFIEGSALIMEQDEYAKNEKKFIGNVIDTLT